MVVAAFVVSIVAVLIAGTSVVYVRRNVLMSVAADRRARTPHLEIALDSPEFGGGIAFFSLRNDDQQDLDSVLIHPAEEDRPPGRFVLPHRPVALMGTDFNESAEVGPLHKKAHIVFAVKIGAGHPSDLHMRVDCRAGKDTWSLVEQLRFPPDITLSVQ